MLLLLAGLLLAGLLRSGVPAAAAAPSDADRVFDAVLSRMVSVFGALKDATFVLNQQEYVGHALQPVQRVSVQYRPPHTVHMVWQDGPSAGQMLLYRPGWNDNRMRVDPGPLVPTLDLDPRGWLATRNQRHDISYVGFKRTIDLFLADQARLAATHGALQATVIDRGTSAVFGVASRCLDLALPKEEEPALYARRVEFCVGVEHGLPTRVRAWDVEDGELRVVESYEYESLRLNVGLADAVFDPATYWP